MTTDTIKSIQRQIVTKLETGEDISELTEQLAQERARIAAQAEVEQLKKIADERQALKDKAAEIRERVKLQGEAIDRFLELRDTIVSQLEPLLEPVKKLVEMQSMSKDGPTEVYVYHDAFSFGAVVNKIPQYYLGDIACPILEMADGKNPAYDKAAEALWYMQAAYGCLVNLKKGEMRAVNQVTDDEIGHEVELNCRVCKHKKSAEINKALEEGCPLRELETRYNVSRSSLSRHKNTCLNQGAVRMLD